MLPSHEQLFSSLAAVVPTITSRGEVFFMPVFCGESPIVHRKIRGESHAE